MIATIKNDDGEVEIETFLFGSHAPINILIQINETEDSEEESTMIDLTIKDAIRVRDNLNIAIDECQAKLK